MSFFAKAFVFVVFFILGASFIATTGALYYEFGYTLKDPALSADWWKFATFYSHLFIFFPTFGIVALVAFYVPACAFTDMYWRHVPLGVMRFTIGFVVLIIISLHVTEMVGKGDLRSMWEVKPDVLAADAGDPPQCATSGEGCTRVPVFKALQDVWSKSSERLGMARFVRQCKPDPLIERPPEQTALRYCFATQSMADAQTCCAAQTRFGTAISRLHLDPDNRSLTEKVHRALLPLKIFFLMIILVIAILLIVWRRSLPMNYPRLVEKIQRGVLVGAGMMLFLPLMNMAFLQASGLLYGTALDSGYRAASPYMVGIMLAWALMILFFFFQETDKNEKDREQFARIGGVVGSGVFALKYDLVVDYFTRILGAGMGVASAIGVAIVCLVALGVILLQPKRVIPMLTKRPYGEPVRGEGEPAPDIEH